MRVAFVACLASSPAVSAASAGEIWFELYASRKGAPLIELRPRLRAGPLADVAMCYSVGALALEELAGVNPSKDFMGRCADGDLLTMQQMTDRAMSIIAPEENP